MFLLLWNTFSCKILNDRVAVTAEPTGRPFVSPFASWKATEIGRFLGTTVKMLPRFGAWTGILKNPRLRNWYGLEARPKVCILLQSAWTSMCRHIYMYNWNIVECDQSIECELSTPLHCGTNNDYMYHHGHSLDTLTLVLPEWVGVTSSTHLSWVNILKYHKTCFVLSVCLLACLSVVNFNLLFNFWTVRVRYFIFGIYTPLMMSFRMTLNCAVKFELMDDPSNAIIHR